MKNHLIKGDWWDDPYGGQEWGWEDQLLRIQGEKIIIVIIIVIANSDSLFPASFPLFLNLPFLTMVNDQLGDAGSSASAYSRPSYFEASRALDQHFGHPNPLPKADGHQMLINLVKITITEK